MKNKITGIKSKILLIVLVVLFSGSTMHPVYVSVTEIEHNKKESTLEISCKINTVDFETVLRKNNKIKIDLLAPADRKAMESLVSNYIRQHLKINVNGTPSTLSFLGYEQNEDAIQSYFEVAGVKTVNSMDITDNILYEYKSEQISIIHVIVDGKRVSTKLNNPEEMFKYSPL